jgi:hypothetical protein
MIKKLIFIVTLVFIFVLIFSDFDVIEFNPENTDMSVESLTERDLVDKTLENWLEEQFGEIYDIKNISFLFETIDNDKNSYIVLTTMLYTFKLQDISQHPVVKTIYSFLKTNSPYISNESKTYLEGLLIRYKDNLSYYMVSEQELNIRFKVFLSGKTSEIFIEGPHNNYQKTEKYYKKPSLNELEETVNKSLNDELANFDSHYKGLFGNGKYSMIYDPQKAISYANTYTSNTSKINDCGDGSFVYQDLSFYNPNFLYYSCTDCTNYVSQSIHAGGIPYDFLWYPGVSIWACADGCTADPANDFFSYMLSHYCFLSKNSVYALPGTIAMFDWNNNDSPDHAAVVVYNDGYTLKFSAHTSDKKEYLLPMNFDTYYLIFY